MNETPVVGQKEVNRESLKMLDKMTKDRQYWASQDDPVSREIESPSDTENPPDPGVPSVPEEELPHREFELEMTVDGPGPVPEAWERN
eukprot:9839105-Karenia_brevis.AAC.1